MLKGLAARTGFEPAYSNAGVAVLTNGHCACLALDDGGCVIGTLFRRHGPASAIGRLDASDTRAILESGGDLLLVSCWGGYVAAVGDGNEVRILRDPSAALSCYFAAGPGFAAFASDARLLVESGLASVELDWSALGRHFLSAGVPNPETALRDVRELLPGFALIAPDDCGMQLPCWSPWHHVREATDDADPAAERLVRVVVHCVRAWTAGRGRLLASVSGGLDSSIVAACLAHSAADVICLTMYGEDPTGDERVFARQLCGHLGLQLLERAYDIDAIEIDAPLAPHLPRTKDRTQAIAYEQAHLAAALEMGAGAFITGNGGDSVFGYSQSAAAIADRLLAEGVGWGLLSTLRDVCRQTGCGPIEAAWSALKLARGPRRYRCRPDPLFLHPDLVADARDLRFNHPWLDAPANALPGKAAQIASILRVQQCFEPDRGRCLPVLNPLMSQPIMELCLSIPSWEWRKGGEDRALAREAFAGMLPASLLRRRVKGGPDGFAASILDRFREEIRERLLEGHLARHHILDRDALARTLNDERPGLGAERVRILEFLAAEAWLDSWCGRAG